jgi:Bacterial protein of unknown function (DUF853)
MITSIGLETAKAETISLSAWERVNLPSKTEPPRDIAVVNFLMSGNINEALFANDVIERNYRIAIDRRVTDQVVDLLDKGKLRHAIITGNVGNGKTTTLDTIACKLSARGHSVFRAGPHKSLLLTEISLVRQMEGRLLLIIDDAFNNRDILKSPSFAR